MNRLKVFKYFSKILPISSNVNIGKDVESQTAVVEKPAIEADAAHLAKVYLFVSLFSALAPLDLFFYVFGVCTSFSVNPTPGMPREAGGACRVLVGAHCTLSKHPGLSRHSWGMGEC